MEAKKLIIGTIHTLFYIESILEFNDPRMALVDEAVAKLMKIYPDYADEETDE
jgi:hypothetical protein